MRKVQMTLSGVNSAHWQTRPTRRCSGACLKESSRLTSLIDSSRTLSLTPGCEMSDRTELLYVPLNKLTRSNLNVRKTRGEPIEDLASSILAHGLLQNLAVTKQVGGKGKATDKYEVIAGGRRLAALLKLAKEKKLPKTIRFRASWLRPRPRMSVWPRT
jgi:hypothetical protein